MGLAHAMVACFDTKAATIAGTDGLQIAGFDVDQNVQQPHGTASGMAFFIGPNNGQLFSVGFSFAGVERNAASSRNQNKQGGLSSGIIQD